MLSLKSKKGGIATSTIYGVGILIVTVITTLLLVSVLVDTEELVPSTINTVTNETGAWANQTGYTLMYADNSTGDPRDYAITKAWGIRETAVGQGKYNYSLNLGNFTVNADGVLRNTTILWNTTILANMTVEYSYTTDQKEELTIKRLDSNMTDGIDEIARKVPTIFLLIALIILMSALVILIRNSGILESFGGGGSSL